MTILKIRTLKSSAIVSEPNPGSLQKTISDHDFLFLGKWLRRSGLDETPQLLQVLLGKMSLIGPRPLILSDIEILRSKYPGIDEARSLLKSKPGISGYWQLTRTSAIDLAEMVKADFLYEYHRTFQMEVMLLILTFKKMITFSHTDSIRSQRSMSDYFAYYKNIYTNGKI
ncbi:O-antigen biosynthesis protein WbqP [Methylococcales bacterium]|nr:O-antigen biosynthesis protein WbqP [Methylococcales bacterium]